MAGGEPRLGTTATYMRHNDHGATHLSTKIDRLHDRLDNEYEVFSAGSVKKWSKFGLEAVPILSASQWAPSTCRVGLLGCRRVAVGIGVYCQPILQISAQT